MSALVCEPIEIKVSEVPNPHAAPMASKSGRIGSPCESSGPLAQNAPASASTIPIDVIRESESPFMSA